MGGCSEAGPSRRRLSTLRRVRVRAASRAPEEWGPAPEGDGIDEPWSWGRRSRAPGHSLRFLTGPRAGGRINSPWRSVQERKERRVVAHPFLEHDGPLAIAHRGGALDGRENSMAAFARAVELGYRYLETDVQVTADDVLVVFHDDRLDRVTDRPGEIGSLTWREVRAARIGGTDPIPLFADVLASWPDVRVNVDPKSDRAVGPLVRTIRAAGALDRVCIGSFSDRPPAAGTGRAGATAVHVHGAGRGPPVTPGRLGAVTQERGAKCPGLRPDSCTTQVRPSRRAPVAFLRPRVRSTGPRLDGERPRPDARSSRARCGRHCQR